MTGSIVCGVGGSDSGKRAVRLARSLGSELGLRPVFVRVVEVGSPDDEISAIAERLERLSECTTEVDCGAGWLVDAGDPAERRRRGRGRADHRDGATAAATGL
jgi:hypothetical protein